MPIININTNSTLADVLANPQSGSDNYALEGNSLTFNNVDLADQNFAQSVADTAEQDANTYSDSKVADSITNGVTTIAPSQNAVFDALALKQDKVSGVSDTEIGYLDGVTSLIQTQLDSKQTTADFFAFASNTYTDSTSYYIGQALNPVTATSQTGGVALKAGVITACIISVYNGGTVASNESCTLNLVHGTNYGTTSLIANDVKIDANRQSIRYITGLNITVTDCAALINIDIPVLSTNPNGLQLRITIFYA